MVDIRWIPQHSSVEHCVRKPFVGRAPWPAGSLALSPRVIWLRSLVHKVKELVRNSEISSPANLLLVVVLVSAPARLLHGGV